MLELPVRQKVVPAVMALLELHMLAPRLPDKCLGRGARLDGLSTTELATSGDNDDFPAD